MKKILLYSLVILLFTTCKKDKDENCTLSVSAAAGSYRVTAVTYRQTPTSSEQDYYNTLFPNPCERDDTFTFNANGTYNYVDAGIKCAPPGDSQGTWSLSGNTVTIDGDPGNVQSFNCSTWVVSVNDNIVVGDRLTITFTRL